MGAGMLATAATTSAATRSLHLLLVDDDAVDRVAVRRAIARSGLAGAEIREASDAATAIALLTGAVATSRFDCILLDYQLAGDTGLDVLSAIRGRGLDVPVVMLTGHGD